MTTTLNDQRLHGLDALRAFALLLGIALHASMSYMPNAEYFWLVQDVQRSEWSALLFYSIHLFRMPLFFLLAGFFAQTMLQQRGSAAFVKNRLKRIVLPLLIAWPVIFSLMVCAIVYAVWVKNNGVFPKEPSSGPAFTADDFPLAHLWFLYVLCLFYAIYLFVYFLFGKRKFALHKHAWLSQATQILCSGLGPFLLAFPVSMTLFYTPYWIAWFGIPTPDHSLYPGLAAWVGFGVAFVFGCLLATERRAWQQWENRCMMYAGMSFILIAICLWRVGIVPNLMPAAYGFGKWLDAWLYASAAWCVCFFLVGLSMRLFKNFDARIRYLADASYWIYLIHLPIILALQAALSKQAMPALLKLLLVVVVCCLLALLSYRFLVRYSLIGTMLNGKRFKRGSLLIQSHLMQ